MTLRSNVTWVDTLVALVIAVGVGVESELALGVIAAGITIAALGIWRIVRFLAALLEVQQAQYFGEEDPATAGDSR